jgi:hypothetical protein
MPLIRFWSKYLGDDDEWIGLFLPRWLETDLNGFGNTEPEQTAMFYRWELKPLGSEIKVSFKNALLIVDLQQKILLQLQLNMS